MKSPSLDALYSKLDKHILLAQAYTEIPELSFIIKTCRLKPCDYIFGKRNNKTVLYKLWFDEFGNTLNIKNKKIEIVYNDLSLNSNQIISTDLYYGLSLDKIAKISQLLYLSAGIDEDLLQECFFLSFLGIDNYLRSYMYLYGEWQQVSSLLLGLENLKLLSSQTDIKYFRNFPNQKNCPIACHSHQEWISCVPVSQSFLEIIKKQYEILLPTFEAK